MKNYIQSSHDILVSALYNIDPLLDQMIASHLLTHENYCEIRTEKIPPQKARKLLEIVQLQMSDSNVWKFVECLKKCKHHYPRLKNWLAEDIGKFSNVANKTPFFISVEQHTLKSIEGMLKLYIILECTKFRTVTKRLFFFSFQCNLQGLRVQIYGF